MDRHKPSVTTSTATRIAWRRIVPVVVVASLLIAAFLFGPVIKHDMEARQAQRLQRMYAAGLSPCGADDRDIVSTDAELLAQLPAAPELSILVYPSFSDLQSIHLVGQDLFYVRRQIPPLEFPPPPVGSRVPKVVKVHKARLSAPVSRGLSELVAGDIAHATAEFPLGLDGETYYFITPKSCGMVWSPPGDTRASELVELFWSLAARSRDAVLVRGKTDDAALLKAIDTLRSGS